MYQSKVHNSKVGLKSSRLASENNGVYELVPHDVGFGALQLSDHLSTGGKQ